MNNIEDSDGNIGSHIKLIRNESIGNYDWSGSSSNRSSDWTKSTLNTNILNGTYYNGLSTEAKNMISSIIWNLGGRADIKAPASTFYTSERGTSVYGSNPKTWTGKIGLIYPSDYGFAVGGNVRESCLTINFYDQGTNCSKDDWLYKYMYWTLTPRSEFENNTFYVGNNTILYHYAGGSGLNVMVMPTLYLNSNITLSGGTGTTTNPFLLEASE